MIEKSEFVDNTDPSTYLVKGISEARAAELLELLGDMELDSFYRSLLMELTVLGRILAHEDEFGLARRLHAMDWLNEIMHSVAGHFTSRMDEPPAKRYPPEVFIRSAFQKARKGGFEHSLEWCVSPPLMLALSRAGLISGPMPSTDG